MSSPIHRSALLQVSFDYSSLRAPGHCPLGCYVMPSLDSPMDWECFMCIHKGLYAGLVLRFHLLFPPTYPASLPAVVVSLPAASSAPPFHPCFSPVDGSVALPPPTHKQLRSGGQPDLRNRAWSVLFALKDLFTLQALERLADGPTIKNREAFRSFRERPGDFRRLVAQSVALSNSPSTLYARGSKVESEIFQFRPLAPAEEARVKQVLLGGPAAPANDKPWQRERRPRFSA